MNPVEPGAARPFCSLPTIDASASTVPLMEADLRSLLSGHELRIDVAAGGVARLAFAANGTVDAVFPDGKRDRGTWRLASDRYCIDWVSGPKNSCTRVFRGPESLELRDPDDRPRGRIAARAALALTGVAS
jgi:hypothetical protein